MTGIVMNRGRLLHSNDAGRSPGLREEPYLQDLSLPGLHCWMTAGTC